MKYLILLILSTSAFADISEVVLNELLFNPGSITPSTGQNCNGDGTNGQDGDSESDAGDEFIEFYNNGTTDVNIEGYCISNREITDSDTSVPTISSWVIPDMTPDIVVPAGGFYHICGDDDGRGFGFSITDAQGNQVQQFTNNSGVRTWASLYLPTTAGDCSLAVDSVIFSEDYGDGESNGEPYLRCFTDGTSPLGFYLNGNGDFSVPSPGSANCTVSTPVYVNQIKHAGSVLEWQAGLEFNHIGYHVYSIKKNQKPERINSQIIASNNTQNYRFQLDEKYQSNKILLTAIDINGNEEKLDYVKANQELGLKESAVPIQWQKQTKSNTNQANKSSSVNELKILVEHSGIQRIRVQDLLNNGLNIIGLNKTKVLLTDNGVPVPYFIRSRHQTIHALDSIVFIAHKADSIYSDQHIYTLSIARNTKHITAIKASPQSGAEVANYYWATNIFEENTIYDFSSPQNDPWIMKKMLAFDQSTIESWSYELPYLAKSSDALNESIIITASINGVTDFPGPENDHHIELIVNNKVVSKYFDGQQFIELTNSQSNNNFSSPLEISLKQPADTGFEYDLVNLDKFSISYPHTFEAESGKLDFLSDKENFSVSGFEFKGVAILAESENGTFLLSGAKINENNGDYAFDFSNRISGSHVYMSQWDNIHQPLIQKTTKPKLKALDYLIVTRNEFIPYLSEYIMQKQAQGLITMVVDTESLYANYGSIYNNPDAIKTYINQLNLIHPISYVMIVGSDQYDYKNYLNTNAYSIVPTYYRKTGSGINHAPTDAPYVDFNNDNIADIAIGRLTVNNTEELINVLQKLQTYRNKDHDKELFITDNIDAENFIAIAEQLSLISDAEIQMINSKDVGIVQANNELLTALNNGTDFVNWIGHSSASRWSRDNVFDINDVNTLENSPAVFFQLGCWNSYFVDPINQTLANSLLQKQDFGAVATIGSSTYTKTDGEKMLAQYFKDFINNNNQATIGQAFNYALKKYAVNNPERYDILLGYQLLGDPTMVVK